MSGEITLTATYHKKAIPVTGKPQLLYTLIEVQPGPVLSRARIPLNFALVLDKSASMRDEKIVHLREAVYWLVDQMGADDILSIAAFDQTAKVIVPAQRVLEKEEIRRAVNRLEPGGGTQMSAGIQLGMAELDKHDSPDRLNRLVILTDGRTSSEKGCLNRADEAAGRGIPLVALGLGTEWKEELLDDMVRRAGGRVDYIAQPQDIVPIFQHTWQGMQIVASNLELTFRLVHGVEVRAVWQMVPEIKHMGYRPISGRAVTLSLPALESGGQSWVVELIAPSRPAGQYRLAQAEVSYDLPKLDLRYEKVKADLIVEYTTDHAATRQLDHHVMEIIERLSAYRLQHRAMEDLAQGNVVGATQRLRAAATRLLELGEHDLAHAAQQEANNLETQGQMSAGGTRKLRYGTRKLTKRPGKS
jgi:Ca-activated chloride channel family protein